MKTARGISIETKFAFAASLALATVVALCVAYYLTSQQAKRSQHQVTDAYQSLVALGNILTKVHEAETGQRGFLLTDRDEFLAPYRHAISTLDADLRRLRELTVDDPAQTEIIDRFEKLIRERLARIREGLETRQREGFEAARQVILTKRGHELMDEIRLVAQQIESETVAGLTRRYDRLEMNSARVLLFFSSLAFANLCLLGFSYGLLQRDLRRKQEAFETQTRLVRELEIANKDLTDFAHVVSHDLKAPLRAISSLAIFLNQDFGEKVGESGRETLTLLQNRVKRLHDLIDGILHYSHMARLQEEKAPVDVKQMAERVVEMLAPPANVRIEIGPMPEITAEPTRLQQIFQNLIGNSIKFMDKPEGRIKVESLEQEQWWRFSVADNGPGIDKKYHEKIFQLFQTLAPRDELETAGVGLSVVKKAVEAGGGKIWVESMPGQGATFLFTVPKGNL